MSFYGYVGVANNLRAELTTILKGLELAWQQNFSNIMCVSDSLNVVHLILGPLDPFHRYAVTIAKIREFFHRDWRLSLRHSLREGNQCADFLSKLGPNCGLELVVLVDMPAGLKTFIQADIEGTLFLKD
uniref:RNase H type-1 domain-containing protein n=1 Tax=Cajanus cajan TaxID=3821 RepID=A0A151R8D1_CAJCA|nr:hypothetical protein KK1_040110 [Cajanus cajan]